MPTKKKLNDKEYTILYQKFIASELDLQEDGEIDFNKKVILSHNANTGRK